MKSPPNLGEGVGPPITANDFHLGRWQRLRNPVGATLGISGSVIPVALSRPKRIQTGELFGPPAVFNFGNVLGDFLGPCDRAREVDLAR